MERRFWTACLCALAGALVGSCAAEPRQEAISSQEWDLKHGGVDHDGCPKGAHRLVGTAGDDVLWGTRKDDCILGLGGNDEIHGLGGDDVLVGGDGDDLLFGDDGEDKIAGGAGADTMYGGNGQDLLLGGQGNDVLDGGNGSDWLAGGDCNDHLIGSRGPDVMLGEGGNDRIEPGHFELVDGGKGVDACRGLHCEVKPEAPACDSDSDCKAPKRCVFSTGVCAAESTDDVCGAGGNEECEDADCDDNDACNGEESCDAGGMCMNGSAPVVDDGNPCTADSCDASSGVSHTPSASGSSCSDGDACNGDETCDGAGNCQAGVPPSSNDGNPCTADACDPATGVTHTPLAAGTSCSDANVCNGEETCDGAGGCAAGNDLAVDDGNPCTADACDAALGVVHVPLVMGASCGDGNACNGDELCDGAGSCVAGTAPDSDDGNPCTDDSCDPSAGVVHTPTAAGASCSDGNTCDGDEACDGAGSCAAGAPLTVDDGNACTADACDPSTGVTHTQLPAGAACGGGMVCSATGVCAPGVCFGQPAGFSCSDRNPCNGSETCDGAGVCKPGVPPLRPPPGC